MVYIIIKACPNQFLTVLSTHPTPILPIPFLLIPAPSTTRSIPARVCSKCEELERAEETVYQQIDDNKNGGWVSREITRTRWGRVIILPCLFDISKFFEVFEWLLFEKKWFEFQFLPKSHSTLKFNFFGALRNLLEELQYQSRAFLLLFFQNVGWPRTSLELLEWKGMLKEVRKFNLFVVTYLFNNEWNYMKLNISLNFHLFSTVYI